MMKALLKLAAAATMVVGLSVASFAGVVSNNVTTLGVGATVTNDESGNGTDALGELGSFNFAITGANPTGADALLTFLGGSNVTFKGVAGDEIRFVVDVAQDKTASNDANLIKDLELTVNGTAYQLTDANGLQILSTFVVQLVANNTISATGTLFNPAERGSQGILFTISAVPLPAAALLFGSVFVTGAGIARRRKMRQSVGVPA